MKLPAVLREGFLQAMPEAERKRLGKGGMTQAQAEAVFKSGEEKKLKDLVVNELNRRGAWIFHQPMSKKTRGRPGVPDIIGCHRGRFFACELKASGESMRTEQAQEAVRIRKAGGHFVLCFCLSDLLEALHQIERIADGLQKPEEAT